MPLWLVGKPFVEGIEGFEENKFVNLVGVAVKACQGGSCVPIAIWNTVVCIVVVESHHLSESCVSGHAIRTDTHRRNFQTRCMIW